MEEITLSVVIVNYNVKYFLEQCLYSLRAALQGHGSRSLCSRQ